MIENPSLNSNIIHFFLLSQNLENKKIVSCTLRIIFKEDLLYDQLKSLSIPVDPSVR